MSRVRSRDTAPEKRIRSLLHRQGLRFRKHARHLAGRPDIVFPGAQLVVFIDGDFWHGFRYPAWRHKVTEFWQTKIEGNRRRDVANQRRLRREGWIVLRLWEHQIDQDAERCVRYICTKLQARTRKVSRNRGATERVAGAVRR